MGTLPDGDAAFLDQSLVQGALAAWFDAKDAEAAAASRLSEVAADRRLAAEHLELMARAVGAGAFSREMLHFLYWETDLPVECIAAFAGVDHANEVAKVLRPGPTLECRRCGGPAEALTRTAIQSKDVFCRGCDYRWVGR